MKKRNKAPASATRTFGAARVSILARPERGNAKLLMRIVTMTFGRCIQIEDIYEDGPFVLKGQWIQMIKHDFLRNDIMVARRLALSAICERFYSIKTARQTALLRQSENQELLDRIRSGLYD